MWVKDPFVHFFNMPLKRDLLFLGHIIEKNFSNFSVKGGGISPQRKKSAKLYLTGSLRLFLICHNSIKYSIHCTHINLSKGSIVWWQGCDTHKINKVKWIYWISRINANCLLIMAHGMNVINMRRQRVILMYLCYKGELSLLLKVALSQ